MPSCIPPPTQSDFNVTDTDIYSDLCTEQLDRLDSLEEENESDIAKSPPKPKNVNIKLQPLDLKINEPKEPKQQQKLTTPGK